MVKSATKETAATGHDIRHYLFIILLGILIFYPPFKRGLFFETEQVWFHLFTGSLLIYYFSLVKRDKSLFKFNLIDWVGLGVVLAYALSAIFAVNLRTGIGEFLKILNYFAVFWLVGHSMKNSLDIRRVLLVPYVSSIIVALIGLGAAYGTFSYNGAFVAGRINSTLQYPNATGIFLGAAAILGFCLITMSNKLWIRLWFATGNFLLIIALLGTMSRGASVMVALGTVLLIVTLPKDYRIKMLINVIAVIGSLITAKHILNFSKDVSQYQSWIWVFVGCVLAAGLEYVLEVIFKYLARIKNVTRYSLLALGAVILLGAIIFAKGSIAPAQILDRLTNMDLQGNSFQARLYFAKDAIKIVGDHPIVGVGGGGWNAVYRGYQSYGYNTTEVHNQFLQVLVETGIVGFAFYVLLWVSLVWTAFRAYKTTPDDKIKALLAGITCAGIALGLHSAMDFSLSLGAVSILLWLLFGSVRGVAAEILDEDNSTFSIKVAYVRGFGIIFGLLIVGVSSSLLLGKSYAFKSISAYRMGDIQQSIDDMKMAMKFDPFSPDYAFNCANLYYNISNQTGDPINLQLALDSVNKSLRRNKANVNAFILGTEILFQQGKLDEGFGYLEDVIKLMPLRTEGYQQLLTANLDIGKALVENGQKDQAKKYLQNALDVKERMQRQVEKVDSKELQLWKAAGTFLTPTAKMNKQFQEAKSLLASLKG